MSYELEYDDLQYDNGYGEQEVTLQIEVEPIFTDETFDAHNGLGNLQSYGDSNALTDFEILDATIFFIDKWGGECGEMSLDETDVFKLVDKDIILNDIINKHY